MKMDTNKIQSRGKVKCLEVDLPFRSKINISACMGENVQEKAVL